MYFFLNDIVIHTNDLSDTQVCLKLFTVLFSHIVQKDVHFCKQTLVTMFCIFITINRHQAYHTRMQLAVLNHNAHTRWQQYQNKDGENVFHRKYRKSSKQWDATPVTEKKKYDYLPKLMEEIRQHRKMLTHSLKYILPLSHDNPSRIQPNIGHTQPDLTKQIVLNKHSHF